MSSVSISSEVLKGAQDIQANAVEELVQGIVLSNTLIRQSEDFRSQIMQEMGIGKNLNISA